MKNNIPYSQWPKYVKFLTALNGSETWTEYKMFILVGRLFLLGGFFRLIAIIIDGPKSTLDEWANLAAIIVISVICIIEGYAIKWIIDNSSWEERFKNKSSFVYKLLCLGLFIVMLWGIFYGPLTKVFFYEK